MRERKQEKNGTQWQISAQISDLFLVSMTNLIRQRRRWEHRRSTPSGQCIYILAQINVNYRNGDFNDDGDDDNDKQFVDLFSNF